MSEIQLRDDAKQLRIIACPSLNMEHGRIDRYVPEGATVAGHLRALGWQPEGLHARVFIDGEFIEQARWEYAVPRAGQSFVTRVIPMGGGGDGGKQALRIVAMVAVVVAAALTAGAGSAFAPLATAAGFGTGAGWAAAAGIAISVAGTLAMSSLVPAPLPRRSLPLPIQEGLKVAA